MLSLTVLVNNIFLLQKQLAYLTYYSICFNEVRRNYIEDDVRKNSGKDVARVRTPFVMG